MYLIYQAINKNNGKFYIGKTSTTLKLRIARHRKAVFKENSNLYFHNALRKYGFDNFHWKIIDTTENKLYINFLEKWYIAQHRSFGSDTVNYDKTYGYNMTLGGDGGDLFNNFSKKKQLEIKKKMSQTRKGKPSGRLGTKQSPEAIKKTAMANTKQINEKKMLELYFEGYTDRKIAKLMSLGRGVIKNRLSKKYKLPFCLFII